MIVTILLENTTHNTAFSAKHGLSVFVKQKEQSFLFDFGPDGNYLQNADKLGIDVSEANFAVLSHGHYDHGGGIAAFLQKNHRAGIYLRNNAFNEFTNASGHYIGLDPLLGSSERLIRTAELCRISDNALLFSGVTEREWISPVNSALCCNGKQDEFSHEQNLLISENDKLVLFGGCAHCGMVNILEKARKVAGRYPDIVFSGMHLSLHGVCSDNCFLKGYAEKLSHYPTKFHTFHCTGVDAYDVLKQILGDQIRYLSTGDSLDTDQV